MMTYFWWRVKIDLKIPFYKVEKVIEDFVLASKIVSHKPNFFFFASAFWQVFSTVLMMSGVFLVIKPTFIFGSSSTDQSGK